MQQQVISLREILLISSFNVTVNHCRCLIYPASIVSKLPRAKQPRESAIRCGALRIINSLKNY